MLSSGLGAFAGTRRKCVQLLKEGRIIGVAPGKSKSRGKPYLVLLQWLEKKIVPPAFWVYAYTSCMIKA